MTLSNDVVKRRSISESNNERTRDRYNLWADLAFGRRVPSYPSAGRTHLHASEDKHTHTHINTRILTSVRRVKLVASKTSQHGQDDDDSHDDYD